MRVSRVFLFAVAVFIAVFSLCLSTSLAFDPQGDDDPFKNIIKDHYEENGWSSCPVYISLSKDMTKMCRKDCNKKIPECFDNPYLKGSNCEIKEMNKIVICSFGEKQKDKIYFEFNQKEGRYYSKLTLVRKGLFEPVTEDMKLPGDPGMPDGPLLPKDPQVCASDSPPEECFNMHLGCGGAADVDLTSSDGSRRYGSGEIENKRQFVGTIRIGVIPFHWIGDTVLTDNDRLTSPIEDIVIRRLEGMSCGHLNIEFNRDVDITPWVAFKPDAEFVEWDVLLARLFAAVDEHINFPSYNHFLLLDIGQHEEGTPEIVDEEGIIVPNLGGGVVVNRDGLAANYGYGLIRTVWDDGKPSADIMIHELGHAFYLQHASSRECGNYYVDLASLDDPLCEFEEYGDDYDPMGGLYFDGGQYNSFYKSLLTWSEHLYVDEPSRGNIYQLQPIENCPDYSGIQIRMDDSREYFVDYMRAHWDFYEPYRTSELPLRRIDDRRSLQLDVIPAITNRLNPIEVSRAYIDQLTDVSIIPTRQRGGYIDVYIGPGETNPPAGVTMNLYNLALAPFVVEDFVIPPIGSPESFSPLMAFVDAYDEETEVVDRVELYRVSAFGGDESCESEICAGPVLLNREFIGVDYDYPFIFLLESVLSLGIGRHQFNAKAVDFFNNYTDSPAATLDVSLSEDYVPPVITRTSFATESGPLPGNIYALDSSFYVYLVIDTEDNRYIDHVDAYEYTITDVASECDSLEIIETCPEGSYNEILLDDRRWLSRANLPDPFAAILFISSESSRHRVFRAVAHDIAGNEIVSPFIHLDIVEPAEVVPCPIDDCGYSVITRHLENFCI